MDEAAEVAVSAATINNPHLSTRQIESYSGISKTNVRRILKRPTPRIVTPGTTVERISELCVLLSVGTATICRPITPMKLHS
jgi:hypothetical protein